MDHSNTPLHWSYSGSETPSSSTVQPTGPWGPPIPRGTKRSLSESDDCDDVFSEGSSKEQCTSPGDADSCQMLSRKKRRGVIEKKRRDRINTSLTELKRLVPSAYEKQGSAKLEKAEILQMTVDHLKMLHAKGLDTLAYDPHKFAMDYHNIGFRECATEVARYLVTIEGMDIQDPLRLRLMSHLQCFAAQREFAAKQSTAPPPGVTGTTNWGSYPHTALHHVQPHTTSLPPPPPPPPPPATATALHHDTHDTHIPHFTDISSLGCTSQSGTRSLQVNSTASTLTPLTTTSTHSLGYQYHPNLNTPYTAHPSSSNIQNYNQSASQKPYRPWGAEVAY